MHKAKPSIEAWDGYYVCKFIVMLQLWSPTEHVLVRPVLGLGLPDVAVDQAHDVRLVAQQVRLNLLHLPLLTNTMNIVKPQL